MKIVDSGDPRVLELRSQVLGCVVFVGLLFVVGGGLVIALTLETIPVEIFIEPELRTIVLAVGAFGVVLGMIFMGGRSGKHIDGRRQVLSTWSGLWVPMRRKSLSVDGYSQVLLVKEVRRGKNSSTTYYPVSLAGGGDKEIRIDTGTDYLKSRRMAEGVARALHRPLTDSTSGEEVVREPGRLDESLRESMRRLGERVEVSPRPPQMRSEALVTLSEVEVEIPGMSAKARLVMNLVVIAAVLGIGLFFFGAPVFTRGKGPWVADWSIVLVAVLFVGTPLVVILGKLRRFNRTVRVTASRVALTVLEGRKMTEIPGDELEELSISGKDISQLFETRPDGSMVVDSKFLDTPEGGTHIAEHGQAPTIPPAIAGVVKTLGTLAPGRLAILARSDRASVTFAGNLDTAETAYLYSAIMKVIVG